MAENESGQEKSEEPTAKRMRDAREKGQVPRSRELNTVVIMIFGSVFLMFFGKDLVYDLMKVLEVTFTFERKEAFDTKYMILYLQEGLLAGLMSMVPLFIALVAITILSGSLLGGWNFSVKAMAFKGSKMNPIKGIKRIFGPKGLMELAKALAKVTLVGGVAVMMFYMSLESLVSMGYQALEPGVARTGELMALFLLALSSSLIIVAAVDVPFQMWDNKKQLRMTKDELKQEHKQQEGSPETRQRIRQAQHEIAQKRMMEKVPDADVVITNPTHYAVALKYDQLRGGAPVMVAKGAELLAARIREVAAENNIPMLSSPALARAIYFNTELDQEIPEGLYKAVAKILAYVFQLKGNSGTKLSKPIVFDDVEIPDDLQHD